MRASLVFYFAFSHSKTAISFNFCWYTADTLPVQNDMLVGLRVLSNFQMYRQNSEKALLGGGGGGRVIAPFPGYANGSRWNAEPYSS